MTRRIGGHTRVAGVVGAPVAHSLSPLIMNAWLEAARIDAVYLAFAVPEAGFEALVDGLRGQVALGLNVTTPFKTRALALADSAEAFARRAGAANLLVFDAESGVQARNTDGLGLISALRGGGWTPDAGAAVVIGAGGAARGAVAALADEGAPEIRIVNRTAANAEAVAAMAPDRALAFDWAEADQALDGAAAVINATSLGLAGQPPLELSLDAAPRTSVAMDMVYRPLETEFLARARARGQPVADGLGMLIAQARPSFEALFGQPPPEDLDIRALCEAALR